MPDTDQTGQESKRSRVKRLLITPLQEEGMKPKRGVDAQTHRAFIDRLCDEVAYLPDVGLIALRRWAEVNGGGSARNIWPEFVSFAAMAQTHTARPIEELPEVASWFISRAGEAAMQRPGMLVAELRFIEHKRRPAFRGDRGVQERRAIAEKASWLVADVNRAKELRDCGRPYDEDMLRRYECDEQRAMRLVQQGIKKRQEAAE